MRSNLSAGHLRQAVGIHMQQVAGALRVAVLRAEGIQLGTGVVLLGAPIIQLHPESAITIGGGVVLCSNSRYTALGVSHPTIVRTLGPDARIVIGRNTGISGASICARAEVNIGERCLLGANVMIADTDFHPTEPSGRRDAPIPPPCPDDAVRIGSDVFIGANAVILKGVTIGEGSIIGAGSVVTTDMPARSVCAGNPCRAIRRIER